MSMQHTQYVTILVLVVYSDWFQIYSYTLLLKPPILMCTCIRIREYTH